MNNDHKAVEIQTQDHSVDEENTNSVHAAKGTVAPSTAIPKDSSLDAVVSGVISYRPTARDGIWRGAPERLWLTEYFMAGPPNEPVEYIQATKSSEASNNPELSLDSPASLNESSSPPNSVSSQSAEKMPPERITAGPCSKCGAMVVGLNACPHCGNGWIGTRVEYIRADIVQWVGNLDIRGDTLRSLACDKSVARQMATSALLSRLLTFNDRTLEEREAAVCPEDYGFEEYIKVLEKRNAALADVVETLTADHQTYLEAAEGQCAERRKWLVWADNLTGNKHYLASAMRREIDSRLSSRLPHPITQDTASASALSTTVPDHGQASEPRRCLKCGRAGMLTVDGICTYDCTSSSAQSQSADAGEVAREIALHAFAQQNPRFALYREQDPTFREPDVNFWTAIIASALTTARQQATTEIWDEAIHIVERVSCVYAGNSERAAANVKGEILRLLDEAKASALKGGK